MKLEDYRCVSERFVRVRLSREEVVVPWVLVLLYEVGAFSEWDVFL